MAPTHAWNDLMWTEMGDIGTLLNELPDEEFDRPSLCDGWAVRDVIGHMLLGHTLPMPQMLLMLGRYHFNVTRGSREQSREYAQALTPAEIRSRWADVVTNRTKHGISRVIRSSEGYVDHTVHHQDIRRSLDRPRVIPDDRLVAALDGAVSVSSPMFSPKKNVNGLRLEDTDVDWAHGTGPGVQGSGEAILMVAAGRSAALADLGGEGVPTLAQRIG